MKETNIKNETTSVEEVKQKETIKTDAPNPVLLIAGYVFIPLIISFLAMLFGTPHDSYFGQSKNIFNLIFAKKAWLWTTAAYVAHLVYATPKNLKNSLVRYVLATLYWFILTQAVFGTYNFRQLVLLATGAPCIPGPNTMCVLDATQKDLGHLISGHCLLLIHSSLFLWQEFYPEIVNNGKKLNVLFIRLVLVMNFFMLITTSVYFHTFVEKITGVFLGSLFWILAYYNLYPLIQL
jgi:hypothetical protein